jgi:hypothetical protein
VDEKLNLRQSNAPPNRLCLGITLAPLGKASSGAGFMRLIFGAVTAKFKATRRTELWNRLRSLTPEAMLSAGYDWNSFYISWEQPRVASEEAEVQINTPVTHAL